MGKTCTPLSWTSESDTTLATVTGASNAFMPAPVSIPCQRKEHGHHHDHHTNVDSQKAVAVPLFSEMIDSLATPMSNSAMTTYMRHYHTSHNSSVVLVPSGITTAP